LSDLEAEDADQAAERMEELDRIERQYPLTTSVLWTADGSMWDQRRSVVAAMTAPSVCLILGGERSGKSRGMKDLMFARALGSEEPAVQRWLWLNRLPKDLIQPGPTEVYVVAQRSGDSVRYHRSDFAKMVGALPHRFINRDTKGEASLHIRTTRGDVGKVWFMSVDQGPDAMQGISLGGAWIDEEPLGEKGLKVYRHLRGRVADQNAVVVITMVPTEGYTWVHDRLLRDREDAAVVLELDTLDNPHLPRERFLRHFAGMDDEEVAQRRFGRFRSRSGSVYSMWADGDGDRWGPGHMCDDFPIPVEWPRFRVADFGLVNPTCVLWSAIGDDDTLYFYGEYYQPNGESYPWHAERVRTLEQGGTVRIYPASGREYDVSLGGPQRIEMSWGDPAAKEAREAFGFAGLSMAGADNDIKGGIDRVKDRLRLQGDNRPRLKVFRSCINTLRELPALTWDPNRKDEMPVKKDDHAADAVRYTCSGIANWKVL